MNIPRIIRSLPMGLRRHKLIRALALLSPSSSRPIVEFNDGARFVGCLTNTATRAVVILEEFERDFYEICAPFCIDHGVVFDVGANLGLCTFGLINVLKEKSLTFHLFEANPELCRLIASSADLHPNTKIFINNGCVTDSPGSSKLQIVEDAGSSYISTNGVPVANIVLDDYVDASDISDICLLKLDIEGYETLAMKGMHRSLAKGVVRAMYVEVLSENLTRAGTTAAELLGLIESFGFDLYHCKADDYSDRTRNSFLVPEASRRSIAINGHELPVAPLDLARTKSEIFHTDILAIRRENRRASRMRAHNALRVEHQVAS